jgi:hypothetical protein
VTSREKHEQIHTKRTLKGSHFLWFKCGLGVGEAFIICGSTRNNDRAMMLKLSITRAGYGRSSV